MAYKVAMIVNDTALRRQAPQASSSLRLRRQHSHLQPSRQRFVQPARHRSPGQRGKLQIASSTRLLCPLSKLVTRHPKKSMPRLSNSPSSRLRSQAKRLARTQALRPANESAERAVTDAGTVMASSTSTRAQQGNAGQTSKAQTMRRRLLSACLSTESCPSSTSARSRQRCPTSTRRSLTSRALEVSARQADSLAEREADRLFFSARHCRRPQKRRTTTSSSPLLQQPPCLPRTTACELALTYVDRQQSRPPAVLLMG
ncbi:hypothetical protein BDZ90DRAFT_46770 [Jaminaea rosea]|uniref:Uncharacterized protein n=1 Tax=Jaminaea rosea TaxID=1569628 RepID=A0A316USR5_9BASI|nr:hypothetical protein BDZ90DRAFT_46770 [Jaminaea rosea]PWN26175.1 hypothetical protein BDZ90DRAFT_46770 [Jaminaea rosea]